MVFKPFKDAQGATRDLAQVIEQLGGDVNAFTSHDETVFHATAPGDAVFEVLDTLVSAVLDRDFDPEVLAREQEVVLEEIHQYRDDPAARSVQALMADLYPDHPYGRTVLGEPAEVRGLTRAILRGWQRRQYRGPRVVLVVAGPFSPALVTRVHARGRALLGKLPSSPPPRRSRAPAPLTTARIRVERDDVQEAYLRMGWIGGAALDADGVALDVAAVALGQGESSRLAVGVRRQAQLVSDAYSGYVASALSGTFVICAQTETETAEQAVTALLSEVETLARLPLDPGEFARARAMLESSLVYRRETVQGQAHALGYFATISGQLDAEAEYFSTLAALTPEQVRRACARYLGRSSVAVTLLLPESQVEARRVRQIAKRLEKACAARPEQPSAAGFSAPTRDEFGTWHARHSCGLRLVARPDPSLPVVGAWLVWPGGLRSERPRQSGISSLTAALLSRGTSQRDGDALAREIEGFAAVLDGFSGHDSIGLQAECLSSHITTVLARALECGTDPSFQPAELDEARRITLADLEADLDDLGHLAYREMLSALYARHPYGRDLRGTPESLTTLGSTTVARSWARAYPIGEAVLSLAGDVDLEALTAALDQLLPAEAAQLAPEVGERRSRRNPPKWPRKPIDRVIECEREQGHIVIGFPGLCLGDPDGAALDVLCSVLGGQAGRLFESLRERRGLVYQVGASSAEHIEGGHVVFYAAASQDKLDDAHAAIRAQIEGLGAHPVTEVELQRAQRCLIGQFESGMQRRTRVASQLVFGEAYDLGANYYLRYPERVAAVQSKQLAALAARLFDPRRRVSVLARAPS